MKTMHMLVAKAAAYPFVVVIMNSFSSRYFTSMHVPSRSYEIVAPDAQQKEITVICFGSFRCPDTRGPTTYFPDKTKTSHAIYHSQFAFREKSSAHREFIF